MATLNISLLGGVRINRPGPKPEIKLTRALQALFAYLIINRERVHHRAVLANLFWGDHSEERARSCLSTALCRLRNALEQGNGEHYLIMSSTGELGFNPESDHGLDITVFEEKVRQISAKPIQNMGDDDARLLEDAIGLYKGDLLEGFCEDWCLHERELYEDLYLKCLERLMEYCAKILPRFLLKNVLPQAI